MFGSIVHHHAPSRCTVYATGHLGSGMFPQVRPELDRPQLYATVGGQAALRGLRGLGYGCVFIFLPPLIAGAPM